MVLGILGYQFMPVWYTALWAYVKGVHHSRDVPRTKLLERDTRLNIDKSKGEDQHPTNGHIVSNLKTPPHEALPPKCPASPIATWVRDQALSTCT